MAEGKYGRLFTEMDLKLVATEAAVQLLVRLNRVGEERYDTPPTKAELMAVVEDAIANEDAAEALTFPADEPLFLLRGQDALALRVVGDYARRCGDGVPVGGGLATRRPGLAHLKAVHAAWEAIEKWQRANPDRVKVPD